MKRILTILPVLSLFLILAAGCSQDSTTPADVVVTGGDDYAKLDFSQEFGGLTASSEDEAFADPDLEAQLLAEDGDAVEDPLADDPEVRRLEAMGEHAFSGPDSMRPRFTYVRLRWGMLRGAVDSVEIMPPCAVTDWTGELHTDRGLVVVKRVIAFERPLDHIIWPRLDPQTVALVSHTGCRSDGLLIQIIERPQEADPSLVPSANQLHINLGPYSVSFDVADLRGLHEVTEVDDLGTRMEITGFGLRDIAVCPKGFLSGRWRMLPEDGPNATADSLRGVQYGTFAGTWFTLNGRVHGFLRGGYGVTADGERVFLGKYIGRRGHFVGFIRGTWSPADAVNAMARFEGRWFDARGRAEGVLGGQAHPVEGYPGGFFVGRWATACDVDAEDAVM